MAMGKGGLLRCALGKGLFNASVDVVAPLRSRRMPINPEIYLLTSEHGLKISINASYPVEEIVSAASNHPFFFQLYVNKHRRSSEVLLQRVWDVGVRTLFLTVDAPVPGKREADERVRADEALSTPMVGTKAANDETGGGLSRTMGTYIDSALNWGDLVWLRTCWNGKVVVKGIQTVEDARRAVEEGVDGIVLRYEDRFRA